MASYQGNTNFHANGKMRLSSFQVKLDGCASSHSLSPEMRGHSGPSLISCCVMTLTKVQVK